MPQHQLPHDYPGQSKNLPVPPSLEIDTDTTSIGGQGTSYAATAASTAPATAAAVATALRAASISPSPVASSNSPSRPQQMSHLKTSSLSPASRPPRTSSLLPPPHALQKPRSEDDDTGSHTHETPARAPSTDATDQLSRHQHTSAAAQGDPPELNTSADHHHSQNHDTNRHHHDGSKSGRIPSPNRQYPHLAQPSRGRIDGDESNAPLSSSHSPENNLQPASASPDSDGPLPDQQSRPGAQSFVPLPPLQLLPPLDRNLDGPLNSIATDLPLPDIPSAQELPRHQMPQDLPRDAQSARGHGRRRSSKGSNDAEKSKTSKPPSQKAMLSRALQKANTAVQLDNAQNLEGARAAYAEACDLLQQVLRRTSADEDKRKLEAIRQTYASRIEELDQMGPFQDSEAAPSKALPARPGSDEYTVESPQQAYSSSNSIASAMMPSDASKRADGPNPTQNQNLSRRPTSPLSQAPHLDDPPPNIRSTEWHRTASNGQSPAILQSSFSKSSSRSRHTPTSSQERAPDMPPPLHSIRAVSPLKSPISQMRQDLSRGHSRKTSSKDKLGHVRDGSHNSWLDGVGESGGSTASSIHSRTSSQGIRRKHMRGISGNTETEFDTALDAAIEAAYDDGYEPMGTEESRERDAGEEAVARVLRKVEMARERVRQTEQETFSLSNGTDMASLLSPRHLKPSNAAQNGFYDENSSDDEERMLEEMARDYDIGDFTMSEAVPIIVTRDEERRPGARHGETAPELTLQPEAARPLQEKKSISNIIKGLGPSLPPPSTSLPELPPPRGTSPMQSVRNRRLSGQNPKQLKIDTTKPNPSPLAIHSHSDQPKSAQEQESDRPATAAGRIRAVSHARSTPSIDVAPSDPSTLVSPGGHADEALSARPVSPIANSNNKLRKNFSSSSLRSIKGRNMSLSNIEDASDMSPGTPSSNHFGSSRTPAVPTIPTPMSSEFRDNMDSSSTGARLFDDHFHQPTSPGSADNMHPDAPVPLEPCPNDFMLRPFWLMRCIFQTLVHPRGGYVSTKLFVPRDVWKVKGVKLRNIDDKIANCDLLTAALLKLAQVDTCDADAVLEEMQSLEGILEQVQASLARKLGSEVGVQGSGSLFKEAGGDADGATAVPRSGSVSNKPSFSWRRLRSKSSGVALGSTYNNSRTAVGDAGKTDPGMTSLPMTSQPTSRPARRDLTQAQFVGPNANYMSSLARLFDAAQAVDQIARQVDDPGLRHADKTQVGLELCTRHAAEFFGFYICRFALSDLSMLLDKFIKRGSEWVLA